MATRLYALLALAIILVAGGFASLAWTEAPKAPVIQATSTVIHHDAPAPVQPDIRPRPTSVKGVYLTAYSAGNQKKMASMIDLIDRTELNAVVIDIKDYSGYIMYDSQVPLVVELKTKDNRLGDVPSLIRELHEHGIYVIARQTVFQDPLLARAKPEWSIQDVRGGLWRDKNGLSWVDASLPEVWNYNLAIAREAMSLGFDEINLDYVRFPSDGLIRDMVIHGTSTKHDVMHDFYHTVSTTLSGRGAQISLDLFGFVMERSGDDDLGIGQRLVDAVDEADVIAPMMYPSHYPSGHLGLANPAADPEAVLTHGLEKGLPVFVGHHAVVRPWIQAFNLGAVYDAAKIRTEIDTVEKYEPNGWLMWNAANNYTDAGLRLENSK